MIDLNHVFVAGIEDDDFKRSRVYACIYCGDTTSLTRDHVVSVSWTGHKRSYKKGDIVPACKECNAILGNKPLHCISKRAAYMAVALEKKYRRLINHPTWSEDELKEMSSRFRFTIKSWNHLSHYLKSRISHCILASLGDDERSDAKQHTIKDAHFYKILRDCYVGKTFKIIEEQNGLKYNAINKMLSQKQYASLINAFKYENNIPFDISISKFFRMRRKALL